MGDSIRSTVRKAAKLAVYEEIMMSVKNHHIPATIRVETVLKNYHVSLNLLSNGVGIKIMLDNDAKFCPSPRPKKIPG